MLVAMRVALVCLFLVELLAREGRGEKQFLPVMVLPDGTRLRPEREQSALRVDHVSQSAQAETREMDAQGVPFMVRDDGSRGLPKREQSSSSVNTERPPSEPAQAKTSKRFVGVPFMLLEDGSRVVPEKEVPRVSADVDKSNSQTAQEDVDERGVPFMVMKDGSTVEPEKQTSKRMRFVAGC